MSQQPTNNLISEHFQRGDYHGWFDKVYQAAQTGEGRIPWAYNGPNPRLVTWAESAQLRGDNRQAVVVGCGLGDDAEYLARLGFRVTAFDISPTAIESAKERFPQSPVEYHPADLFELPQAWQGAFDFVLESRTIQALPWHLCNPAIELISGLLKPNGTAWVICLGRDAHEDKRGIPWPLSREELAHFTAQGLHEVSFEDEHDEQGRRRFCIEYYKPIQP